MTIQISSRGIIELVGDHDIGKTIAAIQSVYPYKKTVFVDDDIKGDGTVRQMRDSGTEFEEYINLGELRSKLGSTPTATQLLEQVVYPTIERLTSKKHEVIIWDTWRIVYESARGHVERNQPKYSNIVQFRGSSQIVQGLISKVARMIERQLLERLRDSCDLLIITHHVKDNYINNVIAGKIPESSRTFTEVCNMRIWLRRNPESKVPIMLFLKRPSTPKVGKGKLKFVNIVPLKITPTPEDDSIWDAIRRYEDKPIENRKPRADETPTSEELAAISGTLSKEQKEYVMQMMKYQQDEIEMVIGKVSKQTDANTPANGVQLLTMAANRLSLDSDKVEEILGIETPDIVALTGDALLEAWEKVNEQSLG